MDISTLSLVELQNLLQQIPAEIKKREEQDKQKVLDELKALAESRGFSLDSLVKAKEKGKVKAVRTVKAKYRNPANPEQTWTGRGRKPQWVAEWIAGGRSIDELVV